MMVVKSLITLGQMIVGRDAFLFVEEPDKVADLVSVDQNKLVHLSIEKNVKLAKYY